MKHHIVASSYLEWFSEKPSNKRRLSKVSVYDKAMEEIREQATGSVACVNDFYAKRLDNGELDHGTEKFFAQVEARGVSAIRKISAGDPVSGDELSSVSLFVTVQSVRWYSYLSGMVSSIGASVSDSLDTYFPDAETAARNMREWHESWELPRLSDPEQAVRHFSDPATRQGILDYLHVPQLAVDAVLKPSWMLGGASAFQTVDSFEKLFLFAPPGESFTTSDVPVAVIDPGRPGERPGFAKRGIAVACPLSGNLFAVFSDPGDRPPRPPRTAVADPKFVRVANSQSVARCDRTAVAGNPETLLRAVHDCHLAMWRAPFARKFRISENP